MGGFTEYAATCQTVQQRNGWLGSAAARYLAVVAFYHRNKGITALADRRTVLGLRPD